MRRRTGRPLGASGSLRAMLARSLGAGSFAGFWRYWNPIFGYGLGRFVFQPLKRFLPPALALLFTFGACGALHDLVTLAVRGRTGLLFTGWFFALGLGVLASEAAGWDFGGKPWAIRAAANLCYLTGTLALVLAIRVAITDAS